MGDKTGISWTDATPHFVASEGTARTPDAAFVDVLLLGEVA